MMSCPFTTQLAELLAGHLPADERDALEDHLAGCALCQQELVLLTDDEEEARWREVLRGASAPAAARGGEDGGPEPSEVFLERLRKELALPSPRPDDLPPLSGQENHRPECSSVPTDCLGAPLLVTALEGLPQFAS